MDYKFNQLEAIINNERINLINTIENVSKIAFGQENKLSTPESNSNQQYLKRIEIAWNTLYDHNKIRFLQFYGLDGELDKSWNYSVDDRLPKSLTQKALEQNYASHFFSCSDACYLNVVRNASNYSFKNGILRIGLLIDNILSEYKANNSSHIIILKATTQSDSILWSEDNINYTADGVTSFTVYEKFKSLISHSPKNKAVLYVVEDKHYAILLKDKYLKDGIIITIIEDISKQYQAAESQVNDILIGSLFLLSIAIFLLYKFLDSLLKNLERLRTVMNTISHGDFDEAESQMPKSVLNTTSDNELELVYQTTHHLIKKLQTTLSNLEVSRNDLRIIAEHDQLTGLYNRYKFNHELQVTTQTNANFALALIDVDFFKTINDTHGHAVGDIVLKEIANILNTQKSNYNIIAGRLGGDEFAMIMPHSERRLITKIINNINEQISAVNLLNYQIKKIGLSIGVAIFPDDSSNLQQLAIFADAAMYENKKLKISSFNFYTGKEEMIKKEKEQKHWQEFINQSLKEKSLTTFFQPLVTKKQEQIYSYEVLLRFLDKETNEYVLPSQLINLAEKSREIIKIDSQSIELSLAKSTIIKEQPLLMFNISNISISDEHFRQEVVTIIEKYHYPYEKIIFELKLNNDIAVKKNVLHFIKTLKPYGFRFALDNFGEGFSSFFHINHLEIDFLKIDKSVIAGLVHEERNHYLLQSILLLTSRLGIKTIAEGVENQKIYDEIKKYDVDYLQGYFFFRPNQHITSHSSKVINLMEHRASLSN